MSCMYVVRTQLPSQLCHTRNDVCLPCLSILCCQRSLLVPGWEHTCFSCRDQNKNWTVQNLSMPLVWMNLMDYKVYFLKMQNLVEYSSEFPVIIQPFTSGSWIIGVNLKEAHQLPTDWARLPGKMEN